MLQGYDKIVQSCDMISEVMTISVELSIQQDFSVYPTVILHLYNDPQRRERFYSLEKYQNTHPFVYRNDVCYTT